MQLVKHTSKVVYVLVELVPNLALGVFELRREFVLETGDFFTRHATTYESHDHHDVTEPEGYPTDEEDLVQSEPYSGALRIVLTYVERHSHEFFTSETARVHSKVGYFSNFIAR